MWKRTEDIEHERINFKLINSGYGLLHSSEWKRTRCVSKAALVYYLQIAHSIYICMEFLCMKRDKFKALQCYVSIVPVLSTMLQITFTKRVFFLDIIITNVKYAMYLFLHYRFCCDNWIANAHMLLHIFSWNSVVSELIWVILWKWWINYFSCLQLVLLHHPKTSRRPKKIQNVIRFRLERIFWM